MERHFLSVVGINLLHIPQPRVEGDGGETFRVTYQELRPAGAPAALLNFPARCPHMGGMWLGGGT